jgi:hypothetical protein
MLIYCGTSLALYGIKPECREKWAGRNDHVLLGEHHVRKQFSRYAHDKDRGCKSR